MVLSLVTDPSMNEFKGLIVCSNIPNLNLWEYPQKHRQIFHQTHLYSVQNAISVLHAHLERANALLLFLHLMTSSGPQNVVAPIFSSIPLMNDVFTFYHSDNTNLEITQMAAAKRILECSKTKGDTALRAGLEVYLHKSDRDEKLKSQYIAKNIHRKRKPAAVGGGARKKLTKGQAGIR